MEPIFTPEQLKMLETSLTKDEIEYKEGNAYIASFAAIRKANKIFSPGNWGYTISSPFEIVDTGKTTKNGSVIFRVRVLITLEVRGCIPIQECGDCEANGTTAQAMSLAEKGAVSDGVKRCLRIYGPAFGLDLYDKDWKPEQEQTIVQQQQQPRDAQARQTFNAPARPNGQSQYPQSTARPVTTDSSVATEKQVKFIFATGRDHGLSDEQVIAFSKKKFGVVPEELTKSRASQLIDALKQPS